MQASGRLTVDKPRRRVGSLTRQPLGTQVLKYRAAKLLDPANLREYPRIRLFQ